MVYWRKKGAVALFFVYITVADASIRIQINISTAKIPFLSPETLFVFIHSLSFPRYPVFAPLFSDSDYNIKSVQIQNQNLSLAHFSFTYSDKLYAISLFNLTCCDPAFFEDSYISCFFVLHKVHRNFCKELRCSTLKE